jgi:hypothetical protein
MLGQAPLKEDKFLEVLRKTIQTDEPVLAQWDPTLQQWKPIILKYTRVAY